MEIYLSMTQDEVHDQIPYKLIAETTGSSIWNTGRRRRMWRETFTRHEQQQLSRLKQQAYQWALVKGVPMNGVKMSPNTYDLWIRFADFCMSL